ncbi:hypothetical protein [Peribacillus simplex]|uniref:hypothetical protein n=1 Tax=Peribacillus simplex TaxID=1478 RepID=UPI0012D8A97C|nr:hypothetical protein [Peribacillus simplex]
MITLIILVFCTSCSPKHEKTTKTPTFNYEKNTLMGKNGKIGMKSETLKKGKESEITFYVWGTEEELSTPFEVRGINESKLGTKKESVIPPITILKYKDSIIGEPNLIIKSKVKPLEDGNWKLTTMFNDKKFYTFNVNVLDE